MPRPCRPGSVVVLVFIALAGLAACEKEMKPPSGDIAGALALPDLEGARFDPATLAGKPAVVMFWRPSCQYCLSEMPVVAKVARDKGATAIAVMVQGNVDKAREATRDFDGVVLVDDGSLRERLDISKVPYTLVLRPDGTAARAYLGEQGESTLAGAVDAVN